MGRQMSACSDHVMTLKTNAGVSNMTAWRRRHKNCSQVYQDWTTFYSEPEFNQNFLYNTNMCKTWKWSRLVASQALQNCRRTPICARHDMTKAAFTISFHFWFTHETRVSKDILAIKYFLLEHKLTNQPMIWKQIGGNAHCQEKSNPQWTNY